MIAKLAGAAALLAVIATLFTLLSYERARDAWRPAAAALGTSGYDAETSDAAYRAVQEALVWVERAVKVAAVLLVAAGVAIGRARPKTERHLASRARRIAARTIDCVTLGIVLACSRITTSSPGTTLTIDWLLPAVLLAALALAAANGATAGDRLASGSRD